MKKIELIYQEILYNVLEKNNKRLTQSELSKNLNVSLSTVNHALIPLKRMNAIEVKPRLFVVIDPKKILYYWASTRDIGKDVVYQTRVEKNILKIEKEMPADVIFGAYTAYKHRFKDVPADYSELYVYGDKEEIEKRFPKNNKEPNLFVLKKEKIMDKYGKITSLGLTFVDLWNLNSWYAKEFLKYLGGKIDGILE